jgi:hypothetical protein
MPLATKNNEIIIKEGKLAENCDCCGGWYCYKCEDGFAIDCRNFGTVSINGNSTFEPPLTMSATSAGVGGCFEAQSGNLFQRTSSTTCELWSISRSDDCAKQYEQWSILPPGTDPRFTVSGSEVSFTDYLPDQTMPVSSRVQSRLTVGVSLAGGEQCGDVRTTYRINTGVGWELWLVVPSSSSTLWQASLICSEQYGATQVISPALLPSAGAITIQASSMFTTTPSRIVRGIYLPATSIVSPRPPDMDIVVTPTIYPARCNDK